MTFNCISLIKFYSYKPTSPSFLLPCDYLNRDSALNPALNVRNAWAQVENKMQLSETYEPNGDVLFPTIILMGIKDLIWNYISFSHKNHPHSLMIVGNSSYKCGFPPPPTNKHDKWKKERKGWILFSCSLPAASICQESKCKYLTFNNLPGM